MPPAKVLLIDDDRDFRTCLRTVLEARGYEVIEAESGKEGLEKIVEHHPSLIVVDIMMECSTEGYSVTQAIKFKHQYEPFRQIPIIMVSSIQESPDELFPMAGEVDMIRPDMYLTKPVDVDKFVEVVERAVAA
jgi:CheY-like chemotaxis protein